MHSPPDRRPPGVPCAIAPDELHADQPARRVDAAAALGSWSRRRLARRAAHHFPAHSPGAANAWLLLVTTKPPSWRDQLVEWPAGPPTLGTPHEGFFYPDPLGFWAEVRRWAQVLVPAGGSGWDVPRALAASALVHLGDEPERLQGLRETCRPRVLLFLDEHAWTSSGLTPVRRDLHHIPDPHRSGTVYEGFWGHLADGTVVGKSPQHPSTHRLYRSDDMTAYLRAAPDPEPAAGRRERK